MRGSRERVVVERDGSGFRGGGVGLERGAVERGDARVLGRGTRVRGESE